MVSFGGREHGRYTALMASAADEAAREEPSLGHGVLTIHGLHAMSGEAADTHGAPRLAAAIRRWRLKQDQSPHVLTVKGKGIDLRIDLPPNVSTQQLLQHLAPLLDKEPD